MTIRMQDYGGGPPALTAELLEMEAGDVTVLTIQSVDPSVKIQQGDEEQTRLTVVFAERPEETFYANKTSIKRLIKALGDEESRWIGKRVPLIAVEQTNPRSGESVTSLWVADASRWEKHLTGHKRAVGKVGRPAKKR